MSALRNKLVCALAAWSVWHCGQSGASAQGFSFTTLAGNAGYGSADGASNEARFFFPQGVAIDSAGTVYVADTENSTIRRIDAGGQVTTVAGLAGTTGDSDGSGSQARFHFPRGVAVDSVGNIYVADTANSTIRQITPAGVVSTVAGSSHLTGSQDGTNGDARFDLPDALAVDASGTLYIADTYNNTIRSIGPSGTNWIVSTVAGSPVAGGNSNGTNSAARFFQPSGIAVGSSGNLFVADRGNNAIRKITPLGTNWVTTTIASLSLPEGVSVDSTGILYVAAGSDNTIRKISPSGTNWVVTLLAGKSGAAGSQDGSNSVARFDYPCASSMATNGILYVADSLNNTIRRVFPNGNVDTVAGLAGGPGFTDGTLAQARFDTPLGLAVDSDTNLYVADSQNNTIRMITPAGVVTTIAGVATNNAGTQDGNGTNAAFSLPASLALDRNGILYVADFYNNEIRRVTRTGNDWNVSTVAGRAGTLFLGSITNFVGPITNLVAGTTNISTGFSGTPLFINYSGAVTNINRQMTNVLIIISSSPFYTNVFNRKTTIITLNPNSFTLPPYQTASVIAGSSSYKNYGGIVTNSAGGVTNLTIVITNTPFLTNVVNGKTQTNWLTVNNFTLPPAPLRLDGVGTNALFYHPSGLALDSADNLYVADGGTNGARIVAPDGTVATLSASSGAYTVSQSQFGTNRLYYHSSAVAVDAAGNIYIADAANNTIRFLPAGGPISTIAGSPGLLGVADGTNSAARFAAPSALALDSQTNLFVIDSLGDSVRKITRNGAQWIVTTVGGWGFLPGSEDGVGNIARFNQPGGLAIDPSGNLYVADTGNNTLRVGSPTSVIVALQISTATNQVVLSWSAAAGGFLLEKLAAPGTGAWALMTNSPVLSGNQLMVTNDTVPASTVLYRLRSP